MHLGMVGILNYVDRSHNGDRKLCQMYLHTGVSLDYRLQASCVLELIDSVRQPVLTSGHIRYTVHLSVTGLIVYEFFDCNVFCVIVCKSHKSACVVGVDVSYDIRRDNGFSGVVAKHFSHSSKDEFSRVSSSACIISESAVNYYEFIVGKLNEISHSVFAGA